MRLFARRSPHDVVPTLPSDGHRWVAALLGLLTASLFFSTALVNIAAGAVSIVALYYWFRYRPVALLHRPLALACLAFLAWVILRDLLAGQSLGRALLAANGFRPLLFVVLWAPLLAARSHRMAVVTVCSAGLLLFALTALATLAWTGKAFYPSYLDPARDLVLPGGLATVYSTLHKRSADISGPVMVAAIFGALQIAWDGPARRWLLFALGVTGACALIFATVRRTSHLAFILCSVFIILSNFKRLDMKAAGFLAAALIAAAGVLLVSPSASQGVHRVVADIQEFSATPPLQRGQLTSSGGLRLRFWSVASNVALESPLFGSGMAAYPGRYWFYDQAMGGSPTRHKNPHNEYLYVLSALGLVGLAAYLAVHVAVLRGARRFTSLTQRKVLILYMIVAMSSMLFNSMVVDMIPGHFHALAILALGSFDWGADACPRSPA